MAEYDLSEAEQVELRAIFGEGEIGYTYGHKPKQSRWDWVLNEWRHGRRVTTGDDPGVTTSPETPKPTFLDGTPMPTPGPPRAEWDRLVALHGVRPRISAAVEAASLVDDFDIEDED